jgi:flagellar biosynthesis chaperone FliJ
MAKFVWHLQRVLDVKKKQAQAMRMELLHLTEQVAQVRLQLMMRQQAIQAMLESVAKAASHERMNRQALAMDFAEGSQAQIKALEEQVETVQARKKEKTEALLALKQASEGLERLRTDAERRFIKDMDKKEQKMADELSVLKYARCVTLGQMAQGLVSEPRLEKVRRVQS